MTFSKQLFHLFLLLLFLFPLQHASNPSKCSSSFSRPLRCGPLEVPIRFPFCDHASFDLRCTDINKTVLELPMSGTFLVRRIDYREQQIYINDPGNCLAKRLLTFNISGTPFSPRFHIFYTFLSCRNEVVLPSWYPSISCLSNSTTSFFATSNSVLEQSMIPACQIVTRLHVPADLLFGETRFSSLSNQSLLLEWKSPNCRGCEIDSLCGFKNKISPEVKCFGAIKRGHLSRGVVAVLICLSIIVAVTLFATCMAIRIYNSRRFYSQRRRNSSVSAATITQQPREIMATRGLDHSTIETYKKMELGESIRPPGTNGIVCPICLSEYARTDTVRFIPECEHCFHVECIDVWLKMHGSCPVCRNSRA
ncbi:putative RING-H2 finger protein ATL21B [Cardamine amara subsp. amara]|uniref:RING-type E3 ubiquitin transferase n=1 Tax=Cardamine amara subsp. amara TaxID=228776 RepID=A0ABD0ZYC0_CARAN